MDNSIPGRLYYCPLSSSMILLMTTSKPAHNSSPEGIICSFGRIKPCLNIIMLFIFLLESNFVSYNPVSLRKKFISKNNNNKIPLRLNWVNCFYPKIPNYFLEMNSSLNSVVNENLVPRTPLYQSSEAPAAGSGRQMVDLSSAFIFISQRSAELMGSKTVPWTLKSASLASTASCLISS